MNVLIVAPAWVGDMVMAGTLVATLEKRFAGQSLNVDLLAPPATVALTRRMPGVRRGVTLDAGHGRLALAERRSVARALATVGYELAVVLPNSFKSALVPFWAGIPQRTGWTGELRYGLLNDRRQLDEDRYPLMIERFIALGLEAGANLEQPYPRPRLEPDPANGLDLVSRHGLEADNVTILCPGAEFGPAKRWPARHYAAVARHERRRGRAVWLLGSPADAAVCAEIAAQVPEGVSNLAGVTRLLDAVDLIALGARVVTNDSGLMHVAAALGRPLVAIYGSTSPEFTPPLSDQAVIVRRDLPCSPCFARQCPLGHLDCLNALEPARVIGQL